MLFRVLGPVEFADEEQRLTVGSAHQRVILAVLLAARGEALSADRLIDAVWAEQPPASARKSLHSHVSRLRRALGAAADVLTTDVDGYRLTLGDHDLDADRFETLLDQARRERHDDPGRAVERFTEALTLWRGEAFGELASHELIRPEASRLDQLRATAVADRTDARLSIGDHQTAIGELEAMVAVDPLAERLHGQLMLALYRDGRQAEALALYRRLQRRLGDEVGVDPSPDLQRLHERILQQDAELAVPSGSPPVVGAVAEVAHTARGARRISTTRSAGDHRGVIGRDDAVGVVAPLVRSSPVVTLTGPGGVGKSTLADQVAAVVGEDFADGVVVCGLAAVRDPASVPAALVETLGVQEHGDHPSEEVLTSALGTRRLLLLLDNCEHLLSAVTPLVQRIRDRCPNVAILATSREHLHLADERVWEVPPLPTPRAGADATEVASTPAGALFCGRAQRVEPSFVLTEDNAPTIAQLCRRLDGIPLAIELAAARVRALDLDELSERIDHRFELLTGGSRHQPGRHRTLHAMVAWSYELLTAAEARLFERLSVFAGSLSLTAAEDVCVGEPLTQSEVAGVLAELVDKSLVSVDRSEDGVRYRLLDTLRAFGARRLEEAQEGERFCRAHATYHVRLVEHLAEQLRGADERRASASLDAVLDDLRVAHTWAVGTGDTDIAVRLPAALSDELIFRPRYEVFAWADLVRELPGALKHPAFPAAVAVAARGALNRGELDRAQDLARTALNLAEGDGLDALHALYVLTTVALFEGRLHDALSLADRRRALADEIGQTFHRSLAGVSRALALMYRGASAEAAAASAEARRDAEASGNHTAQAWALYGSGEALLDEDADEAAVLLERAIAAARRVDRRFIEGVALVSLASLCGRRGQTGRALELFRTTIAHWRSLGVYAQQLTTLRNLVELLVHVGVDEPAAFLHGAVTAGATPSFGAEADRLTAAWQRLEERLGVDAAHAAAERGRRSTPDEMVDRALAHLDALLAER